MSPRTVDRVENWDAVPYDGGYGGLQDLASDEFSGLVTAGPTRLFMIRGTVVGILDGSMDAFEGADGTAREAPRPALALLAVMQERSDEVRAKYYTEDTPISDVDSTLANGGFTGYVELSENVLSGDYYLVYHRGESMSVAYVGASERLITDDDAFEQAADEVGIFEVRPVDVEPIEIPDPSEAAGETATGPSSDAGADDTAATDADATTSDSDDIDGNVAGGSAEADAASASGDGADGSAGATATGSTTAESGTAEGASPETGTDDGTGSTSEPPVDGSRPSTDEARTSADETTGSQPSAAESDRPGGQTTGDEADSEQSRRSDPERPAGQNSATADGPERANDHPAANADRAANTDGAARDTSRQSAAGNSSRPADDGENQANASRPPAGASPDRQRGDSQAAEGSPSAAGSGGSAADLETRSIPSLNPSRTHAASADATPDAGSAPVQSGGGDQSSSPGGDRRPGTPDQQADTRSPGTGVADESTADGSSEGQRAETTGRDQSDRSQGTTRASRSQSADGREESGDSAATLRTELAERERELEDLRSDLQRVEAERDDLETERDRLQSELEEARAEIERLEERLADFGDGGDAATAQTQLSAREAIDQTNLFVRYDSKGEATLESAHAGDADRSTVGENLRLEYHTQFDADETAVGSESFDEFLPGTIQYRFVDWLVGNLLYEIRDTGHTDAMGDLYGALPKIDRAELNGRVTVQYTENGEEHRSQEGFDVVVRNRMGNPLVVANINESRDPASESMMTDLVKRAERVGESNGSLAAAFLVTESFFEPEALETAEEATSNGLFSRDSHKSFVNLSRKDGYHLCLVEARNREFHLAVPEL